MEGPEERLWMYKRRARRGLGISSRFEQGVLEFDEFVKQHGSYDAIEGTYLCPCKKCKNVRLRSSEDVKEHLYKWGFVVGYWYWIYHGETDPRDYHYGESSEQVMEDNEPEFEENYMQNMMNDVIETNEAYAGHELPNSHATRFLNMLNSAQEPSYEGCPFSELNLHIRLLSIKADFNPSEKHFKAWVALFKEFMPPTGDRIPKSIPILMRKVTQLGLDVQIIDCCPNRCMLYYKEFVELDACKFCGHARRKSSKGRKKLGPSYSKLYYLPLTDRLQRLYASRYIAPHMRWHKEHEQDQGVLRHPSDARAWKYFDSIHPQFAAEPQNVRLGLCADSFTPYKDDARSYSIWPVVLTPYNLPPNMCMNTAFMFLTLLIPGPKSPGNRIDVYLQPLIDELKFLWNEGVETYDISCGRNFTMRAMNMWTVNDFPAHGMLSGWSTHGKLSCPVCMDRNTATTLTHRKKQTWFDHHRCFLPMDHRVRWDKKSFTKGEVVMEETPIRYPQEDIWEMIEGLDSVVDKVDFTIHGFRSNQNNWTKRSIFWDLPYWKDNILPHNIDIMHTEKNFSENIINTVMDTARSKDDLNAMRDMAESCERPELNLIFNGQRVFKPKAKRSLTLEQRRNVCEWMRGVRLPDGYGSNPKNLVHPNNKEFAHMKSHDHHVFLQTLLPVAFSALPKEVLEPLVELSQFFKNLCASELHEEKLQEMLVPGGENTRFFDSAFATEGRTSWDFELHSDAGDAGGGNTPSSEPNYVPQTLPPPPHPDARPFITPNGDGFSPWSVVKCHFILSWQARYQGAWTSFVHFPRNVQLLLWDDFTKRFQWDPKHDERIQTNYRARITKNVRNYFQKKRKKLEQPPFIRNAVWQELLEKFRDPEYVAMCKRNSTNRKSDPEGVADPGRAPATHQMGAIPFYEARRRRAGKELALNPDLEPTFEDLYKWVHFDDAKNRWRKGASGKKWDRYLRDMEAYLATQPDNSVIPSNELCARIYVLANMDRNGRVSGFGSESADVRRFAGYPDPRSLHYYQPPSEETRILEMATRMLGVLEKAQKKGKKAATAEDLQEGSEEGSEAGSEEGSEEEAASSSNED